MAQLYYPPPSDFFDGAQPSLYQPDASKLNCYQQQNYYGQYYFPQSAQLPSLEPQDVLAALAPAPPPQPISAPPPSQDHEYQVESPWSTSLEPQDVLAALAPAPPPQPISAPPPSQDHEYQVESPWSTSLEPQDVLAALAPAPPPQPISAPPPSQDHEYQIESPWSTTEAPLPPEVKPESPTTSLEQLASLDQILSSAGIGPEDLAAAAADSTFVNPAASASADDDEIDVCGDAGGSPPNATFLNYGTQAQAQPSPMLYEPYQLYDPYHLYGNQQFMPVSGGYPIPQSGVLPPTSSTAGVPFFQSMKSEMKSYDPFASVTEMPKRSLSPPQPPSDPAPSGWSGGGGRRGGGRRKREEPTVKECEVIARHVPRQIQASPAERDPHRKPSFSYVALVTMIIEGSPTGMLTLQEIYNSVAAEFPFYRLEEKTWQNSIRHTMSFNDCFIRVQRDLSRRSDGSKDRGGYWAMHPNCGDMFSVGRNTLRRSTKFRLPGKAVPKRKTRKGGPAYLPPPSGTPHLDFPLSHPDHQMVRGEGCGL